MPFICIKTFNSPLVKTKPLSDTIISGRPWVAKVAPSFSMVYSVVAEFTQWTSSHLE